MTNQPKFPPRISWKADQTSLMIGEYQDTPEWRAYLSLTEHAALLQASEEMLGECEKALEKYTEMERVKSREQRAVFIRAEYHVDNFLGETLAKLRERKTERGLPPNPLTSAGEKE